MDDRIIYLQKFLELSHVALNCYKTKYTPPPVILLYIYLMNVCIYEAYITTEGSISINDYKILTKIIINLLNIMNILRSAYMTNDLINLEVIDDSEDFKIELTSIMAIIHGYAYMIDLPYNQHAHYIVTLYNINNLININAIKSKYDYKGNIKF
jgi:hypothetical protein